MGFLRKLLKLPHKPPQHSNPPSMPTTFNHPDPFSSPAQFQAVKDHIQALQTRDPARYALITRLATFQAPLGWLQHNFPDSAYDIVVPGPFPDAFPGPLNGPGLEHVQPEDTRVYVVRKKGVRGTGGIVLMKLVIYMGPPSAGGAGEDVSGGGGGGGGEGRAGAFIGTPAMKTAVDAFLGLLRRMSETDGLGACTAVVGMGFDMEVYHYTYERGFVDPPEGFSSEVQRVEWDREGILPKV